MRLYSKSSAALVVVVATMAGVANARDLFHFDLESLVWMSTDVVEGAVTTARQVPSYADAQTVKVEKVYAGDKKVGDEVVVGLSAFGKQRKDKLGNVEQVKIALGDKGIWFVAPGQMASNYWPAGSGVKLIVDGIVTGMEQLDNPGPYVNAIDEGDVKAFREKVEKAVKDVAALKNEFEQKKGDAAWLVGKLKERPVVKDNPWLRDAIAAELCRAILATKDAGAIKSAREMGRTTYEVQLLGG